MTPRDELDAIGRAAHEEIEVLRAEEPAHAAVLMRNLDSAAIWKSLMLLADRIDELHPQAPLP